MKYNVPRMLFIVIFVSISLFGKTKQENCAIIIEPKWRNLEQNQYHVTLFGGKWILAGSITFRKKSKDTIYLSKLTLRWKGKKIENLLGSLYKKNFDKKFLPIEDFLISDSSWNRKRQALQFSFKKPVSLGPTNIFYLVLTVPEQLESVLKTGSFTVEATSLPTPFKTAARQHPLTLAFSELEANFDVSGTIQTT